MWRTVLTAVIAYGYGAPQFDGSRPASFDRPLQTFHVEIDHAARVGGHQLMQFKDNVVHFVVACAEQVQGQVNGQ